MSLIAYLPRTREMYGGYPPKPEWVTLRGLVIRALQPYPEARDAVVEALWAADDQGKD